MTTNTNALTEYLKTKTKDHYSQFNKPLLLSQLGIGLSTENRASLGELSLAQYIAQFLADEILIIESPHDKIVKAVIPKDVELAADLGIYFGKNSGGKNAFRKSVWAAFTIPISAGKKRFLLLEDYVHFVDVDEADSLGSNSTRVLINSSQIPIREAHVIDTEYENMIADAIKQWAKRENVANKNIYFESHQSIPKPNADVHRAGNALDALLGSLNIAELSRLHMPLDIVSKLRRQKI